MVVSLRFEAFCGLWYFVRGFWRVEVEVGEIIEGVLIGWRWLLGIREDIGSWVWEGVVG